jgi:hypothetical protein
MSLNIRRLSRRFAAPGAVLLLSCAISTAAAAMGIHNPDVVATARPTLPQTPQGGDVVLTFEGLGDQEAVNEFYNGGTGGSGSGPGPNYGVVFSDNSLSIIDSDDGGTGNFGGEPSPSTILFFLTGAAATMNVPAGFTTGFSFYYSAINNPGVIRVYDGPDATGNVLATLDLPVTPTNGAPDPTGQFSPLVPIGVTFTGTAHSVDFGGTINQVGFDNITLGSGTPGGGGGGGPTGTAAIPAPTLSPAWLIGLAGMLALVGVAGRRWRSRR